MRNGVHTKGVVCGDESGHKAPCRFGIILRILSRGVNSRNGKIMSGIAMLYFSSLSIVGFQRAILVNNY